MSSRNYWLERGRNYLNERIFERKSYRLQENRLLEVLSGLSFRSVLEAGCGFGRITKLVAGTFMLDKYTAFDLSADQIANARHYVNNNRVDFMTSDIMAFQATEKYDLVLTAEVLLHFPPEEIRQAIQRLLSLSKRYFVHVDWHQEPAPAKTSLPFNHMHDYDAIYQELGLAYQKALIPEARQAIYTVTF